MRNSLYDKDVCLSNDEIAHSYVFFVDYAFIVCHNSPYQPTKAMERQMALAPEDFGPLRSVIEKQAAGRSDHAPFEARKIPFLFFSTSENDDYHQPTDTIDKIDPAALHNLSRTIHATVRAIDALAERPTFVDGPPARGGKAKQGGSANRERANREKAKREKAKR